MNKKMILIIGIIAVASVFVIDQAISYDNSQKVVEDKVESTVDMDKILGGPGNRHPAFLGFFVDSHCTDEMIQFMKEYTSMFERGTHLFVEFIGLPEGMNKREYHSCFEGTKAKRGKDTRTNSSDDRAPTPQELLALVMESCECKANFTQENCYAFDASWTNGTHTIDTTQCAFISEFKGCKETTQLQDDC